MFVKEASEREREREPRSLTSTVENVFDLENQVNLHFVLHTCELLSARCLEFIVL